MTLKRLANIAEKIEEICILEVPSTECSDDSESLRERTRWASNPCRGETSPWKNISGLRRKSFQSANATPLDGPSQFLRGAGDASAADEALRTGLVLPDQDFGAIEERTDGIGMNNFDNDNINGESTNYSGRRLHLKSP